MTENERKLQLELEQVRAQLKARDKQLTAVLGNEFAALTNFNIMEKRFLDLKEEYDTYHKKTEETLKIRNEQLAKLREEYNTSSVKYGAMKWFAENAVAELPGANYSTTIDSHALARIIKEYNAHVEGEKHRANIELVHAAYEVPAKPMEVQAESTNISRTRTEPVEQEKSELTPTGGKLTPALEEEPVEVPSDSKTVKLKRRS